jgi:hypothetical protein
MNANGIISAAITFLCLPFDAVQMFAQLLLQSSIRDMQTSSAYQLFQACKL